MKSTAEALQASIAQHSPQFLEAVASDVDVIYMSVAGFAAPEEAPYLWECLQYARLAGKAITLAPELQEPFSPNYTDAELVEELKPQKTELQYLTHEATYGDSKAVQQVDEFLQQTRRTGDLNTATDPYDKGYVSGIKATMEHLKRQPR